MMLKRSKTYPPHGLSRVLRGNTASEESDSYFDSGLFRTASGTVIKKNRREKNEMEFLEALGAADVYLDAQGRKMAFLLANFGDVKGLKTAFQHGVGTGLDSYDWEGAGFTDDEIRRLREYLLRGVVSRKGKVYRDSICSIL